jgi:hypothetical protein
MKFKDLMKDINNYVGPEIRWRSELAFLIGWMAHLISDQCNRWLGAGVMIIAWIGVTIYSNVELVGRLVEIKSDEEKIDG